MPTIKELRQICQQSEVSPSWLSQSIEGRLNRIFSIYFTWLFSNFSFITPNRITIIGTLVYLTGAAVFVFHNFYLNFLGAGLIFFSFVLDACDGELARYRKAKNNLRIGGLYVEPVSHDIMYGLFFLPIGLGEYFRTGLFWPLVAVFIATSFKLLFRLLEFRFDGLARHWASLEGGVYEFKATDKPHSNNFVYFIYRNLFPSTGILLPLIIAGALGRLDIFLYFYAISYFGLWLILFMKKTALISKKIRAEEQKTGLKPIEAPESQKPLQN